MREVKYTTRFQRDYGREKSGPHGKKLDALLMSHPATHPAWLLIASSWMKACRAMGWNYCTDRVTTFNPCTTKV
jgi:hypothetical protein